MAVLKLTNLVSRISGKIGGSVFVYTKYGQVVKNNAYSLPQNSQSQKSQQSKIQFISSKWLLLTTAQKNAWSVQSSNYFFYNKVGQLVNYNGYSLFLMLNNNLAQIDLPVNINVPVFVPIVTGVLSIVTAEPTVFEIKYVGGFVGQTIFVYASNTYEEGKIVKENELILIGSYEVFSADQNFLILADYLKIFNPITSKKEIAVQIKPIVTLSGNKSDKTPIIQKVTGSLP